MKNEGFFKNGTTINAHATKVIKITLQKIKIHCPNSLNASYAKESNRPLLIK